MKETIYQPGDLTEPNQQHHSKVILNEKSDIHLPELNDLYVEKTSKFHEKHHQTKHCDDTAIKSQISPKNEINHCDCEKSPKSDRNMRQDVSEKPGESSSIPLIPASCNFQAARKMAQENLEHQPLPDSIMDRAYLKLQAQGILNPELALNVEPTATGLNFHHYFG